MAILTRESILGTNPFAREVVPVPKWGGDIILQEMSAFDRETLRDEMGVDGEKPAMKNLAGKVLCRCIVNEVGERLFSDEDHEIVARKDQETLQILLDKAMIMNRMVAVKGEDEEKKSEPSMSEDLPSASA
jgi:hypothetical protein